MFQNIKIAFFDMDGTLYNHNIDGVSSASIRALKKLKENGIIICVATGRPMESLMIIKDLLDEVEFDYLITSNGQAIYENNKLVYKNYLHPDDVKAIIKKANELNFSLALINEKRSIITKLNDIVIESCQTINHDLPEVSPVSEDFNEPVDHLICYETQDKIKYFAPLLKHTVITHWTTNVFDFVPNNGVKAHGIMKVLEHLAIDSEQAVAFGDGQNDIDMLKYVGFGIAMGNASLEVQEAADYVCETIEYEGVAKTLKKLKLI